MRRHRMSPENSRRGFTLVELMIVLAIMVVLAGVAAPRYANAISRYRVDMASRRIAADLNLASLTARQTGKPIVVAFDQTASTYTMAGVTDLRQSSTNYFVDLSADPYSSSIAVSSVAAGNRITFNIYGQPDCAGQVVVRNGAFIKTATLDPTSGRVTIQ